MGSSMEQMPLPATIVFSVWPSGEQLSALLQRSREPPAMPFRISDPVLSLTVRHVFRFALDLCSAGVRPGRMRVNVLDIHHQAGAGRRQRARRSQLEFFGHAMQPNHEISCAYFGMNGLAFRTVVNAPGGEAKGIDEEIVFSLNILAHKDWNESFDLGHSWLVRRHLCRGAISTDATRATLGRHLACPAPSDEAGRRLARLILSAFRFMDHSNPRQFLLRKDILGRR